MKQVNRIISFVIDIFALILCGFGLCLNIFEGVVSRSDKLAIILFAILLIISAYNLVRSIKKLKDSNN